MDPRLIAHFYAEAEGVHRQEMARTAQSVAAGFSDKAGYTSFINSLELSKPSQEDYNETWEMLRMLGGNKK